MSQFLRLCLVSAIVFSLSLTHAQGDDLQTFLDEMVAPEDTAVVALISTSDETYTGAAGAADLETGDPATVEDRFRIGSITKTYTATLVLLLQEDGLLSIDDLMSTYLPEEMVAQIPYGDEITLRHLLTMTSGIFNYTEDDSYYEFVLSNPDYIWTAEESIEYIYDEEPYFAPDEGYYYSNTNYNLLQIVIEAATGNSLSDEFESRIFEPLGMANTDLETNGIADGLTRGYTDLDGDGILDDVTAINDVLGMADGGIVSTLADMELFGNALFREGSLLSEDSWAQMQEWVDDGEGGYYGLGLSLYETDEGNLFGHSGATAGFLGEFYYVEDSDLLIVAFSNNFDYETLGTDIFEGLWELGAELSE